MPLLSEHVKVSLERTGREYREVHEWLDADPDKKAERHDITKIYDCGKFIDGKYGTEAANEYLQHIHDDVKARFSHIRQDLEKAITETLAYFGVR